jgi:serine/threonine protein kinase
MVKLADFGVAMKLTDSGSGQSSSVEDGPDLAGSPYWMAPEIIEMSTPTSACDIWCVEFRIATIGCH